MDKQARRALRCIRGLCDLRRLVIDRPTNATLRPCCQAISIASLMRWIDDEKQEMNSRRSVLAKISSNCVVQLVRSACNRGVRRWWNPETAPARPLCRTRRRREDRRAVVGRRRIDLEVAGVDDDAQRRVNRQCDAIHQAVRHLNRDDGERPDLEAFVWACISVQHRVIEQAVLFQLAFDIGERELGAVDRHVQLRQHPGQARRCGLRDRASGQCRARAARFSSR